MNLAIICGGKSFEHEISVLSTIQIYKGIQKNHYENIFVIYITKENELFWIKNVEAENFVHIVKDKPVQLIKQGFRHQKKEYRIDFGLIIMHGNFGEDGRINALLDFYDIPYGNNSILSSNYCLDKVLMKEKFVQYKIPCLDYYVLNVKDPIKNKFDYPVILKAAKLGSSIGIEVCKNEEEFKKMAEKLFLYDNNLVIEPYLENFEEFNLAVKSDVERGVVLSNIEKVEKTGDILSFDNKYKVTSRKVLNPEMDERIAEEIRRIAFEVYEKMGLSYVVRFDFMVKNQNIYLNEVNNIPGSLSYYLFNESIDNHIYGLIKFGIFHHKKENQINYSLFSRSSLLDLKGKNK